MPEMESVQESVQHCFELAASRGLPEEDLASEAFELLIANDYDRILAHALGVSL